MKELNVVLQSHFKKMCEGKELLFRSVITGDELWELYLNSFDDNNDPVFRDPESSSHNCNNCKNFIRRYGNLLSITDDYKIESIFSVDVDEVPDEYKSVVKKLNESLIESDIKEVFVETHNELKSLPYESVKWNQTEYQLGVPVNTKLYTKEECDKYGVVTTDKVYEFNHINLKIDNRFIDKSGNSINSVLGNFNTNYELLNKLLDSISYDKLELVNELILNKSLINGDNYSDSVRIVMNKYREYNSTSYEDRHLWKWNQVNNNTLCRFVNSLIGVLCTELTSGVDLDTAWKNWNKRADPVNYMKAKSPITQSMIDSANKFITENGYIESFNRRLATIDDIKVTEIKYMNESNGNKSSINIFDKLTPTKSSGSLDIDENKLESVNIEHFMNNILPNSNSLEIYVDNRLENNLVTLTTSSNNEGNNIFKWNNNYSWTYRKGLAGVSQIKERVKSAGGNVSGKLRASLIWNESGSDSSDMDLHCIEPSGREIYFASHNKQRGLLPSPCGGLLDLDNTNPKGKLAIENIFYTNYPKESGNYLIRIRQYAARNPQNYKVQIEIDGDSYDYQLNPLFNNSNRMDIAKIYYNKTSNKFIIDHLVNPINKVTKEVYGLKTNQFHKVNLVCLSPNYWDDKVGNKHYFFMIDGCKTDNDIVPFHNENIINDIRVNHRKVLEVLSQVNRIKVNPDDEQLSGLGFDSTVRNNVVVKINNDKLINIKF